MWCPSRDPDRQKKSSKPSPSFDRAIGDHPPICGSDGRASVTVESCTARSGPPLHSMPLCPLHVSIALRNGGIPPRQTLVSELSHDIGYAAAHARFLHGWERSTVCMGGAWHCRLGLRVGARAASGGARRASFLATPARLAGIVDVSSDCARRSLIGSTANPVEGLGSILTLRLQLAFKHAWPR
jgi:hypothetical protein